MSSRPIDEIRAGYVRHGELAEHARVSAADESASALLRAEQRVHSLLHRYFELLEHPAEPIEEFADLFADEFAFDFTMTQIETLDQFSAWATGFRSGFKHFTLTVLEVSVDASMDPLVRASIDLDFDAVDSQGDRKAMATRHEWSIRNGKIESISVVHRN